MSYYESEFYQRWFTYNTYSPAERRWAFIGTIVGCGIGGAFSAEVGNFMASVVHDPWGHVFAFIFVGCCAVGCSELARRIVHWRERAV